MHEDHIPGQPVPVRILVDSAVRAEVEPWLSTGVAHGVTTNPTLLKRAGLGLTDLPEVARWATGDGQREVCFQIWGESVEEQYAAAMRLRELAPTATMKIPVTPVGATVISRLHAQGVPVLMTAVYAAKQVTVASALGVRYLAPYFNRMNLAGRDALAEIRAMTEAVPQDGSGPLVMAASVKSAQQVMQLIGAGVRVFTLPPSVIADLFDDELTTRAVLDFEADMAEVRRA
ncbi:MULTISPECIES: transaldolase family protein [unclassified Luteococcus]|uniref:transaldolase family protein n=1 Tax=unclassified Luteococcus TaxID=2639923 RepID=UPI00313E14FB